MIFNIMTIMLAGAMYMLALALKSPPEIVNDKMLAYAYILTLPA